MQLKGGISVQDDYSKSLQHAAPLIHLTLCRDSGRQNKIIKLAINKVINGEIFNKRQKQRFVIGDAASR